jgi:VanZ family protein
MLVMGLLAGLYLATTTTGVAVTGGINDKLVHLIGFCMLALLADISYPGANYALCKAVPLTIYGLLIEIIQLYLPYRTFSLFDLFADSAGLLLYGITLLIFRRRRSRIQRMAVTRR